MLHRPGWASQVQKLRHDWKLSCAALRDAVTVLPRRSHSTASLQRPMTDCSYELQTITHTCSTTSFRHHVMIIMNSENGPTTTHFLQEPIMLMIATSSCWLVK